MASYTILKDKSGEYKRDKNGCLTYVFKHNRGDQTPLQERWKPDPKWSPSKLESQLQKALGDFEARCVRGEVQSRAERKAAQEAAEEEARKNPTLQKYVDETWLPAKRIMCSEGSVKLYEQVLRLHIVPVLGSYRMNEITAGQVKTLLIDLLTGGGDINNTYRVLSGVFSEAERDDVTTGNIMRKVRCPKPNKDTVSEKKKSLTEVEVGNLMDILELQKPITKALVMLLVDTGARIGEVLALQWESIDWKNSTVKITGTRDKQTHEIRTTKTKESRRDVTVGKETLQALRDWREEQESRGHRSGDVFTGRTGAPLRYKTAREWTHRLGHKIGVDELHPHMLRHSAATIAIENGASIPGVSRRLGHKNVNTTLEIYTNPTDKAADDAGCSVRNAINQARETKKQTSGTGAGQGK